MAAEGWTNPQVITCTVVICSAIVTLIGIVLSYRRTKMQLYNSTIIDWKGSLCKAVSYLARDFTEAAFIAEEILKITDKISKENNVTAKIAILELLKERYAEFHEYEKSLTSSTSFTLIYLNESIKVEKVYADFIKRNYHNFRVFGRDIRLFMKDIEDAEASALPKAVTYNGYRFVKLFQRVARSRESYKGWSLYLDGSLNKDVA